MTLIAVSGVDGSGKSTQIELLERALKEDGLPASVHWFRPGYGPVAMKVKRTMRLPSAGSNDTPGVGEGAVKARETLMRRRSIRVAWLLFAALDSLIETGLVARLRARGGRVAIYDRWVVDALLDLRINFPDLPRIVRVIEIALLSVARRPDVALLLMVPEETASERLALKDEPFPDSEVVARQRRLEYEKFAHRNSDQVVSGAGSQRSVHRVIWHRVERVRL